MVTPLCTQLTYEGLIDEVIGINNCKFADHHHFEPRLTSPINISAHVEVDPNLVNPAPTASTSTPSSSTFTATPIAKRKKHLLSSTDTLFATLRDKNFAVVGAILNKTARRLNDDYERRHLAKTPGELRAFVGQLGGLQLEHQALRLRECSISFPYSNEILLIMYYSLFLDTGLTEQIMGVTGTDDFNTALEIQQSKSFILYASSKATE